MLQRDFAKQLLSKNGRLLLYMPKLKMDKEMVLISLKNGGSLSLCDNTLLSDYDIVLAAVIGCGYAISYSIVNRTFRENPSIALAAVKNCGEVICYFSSKIREYRVVVLEAIKSNGRALAYINEILQSDYEINLASVLHCGIAIRWSIATLKSDALIIIIALRNDGSAIEYAVTEGLNLDRSIFLNALISCTDFNALATNWPQSQYSMLDDEALMNIIKNNPNLLKYLLTPKSKPIYLSDIKFRAERSNQTIDGTLPYDEDHMKIVLAALSKCGRCISYIPRVKITKIIIVSAIKSGIFTLYDLPDEFFTNGIITLAVTHNSADLFIAARKSRMFRRIIQSYGVSIKK